MPDQRVVVFRARQLVQGIVQDRIGTRVQESDQNLLPSSRSSTAEAIRIQERIDSWFQNRPKLRVALNGISAKLGLTVYFYPRMRLQEIAGSSYSKLEEGIVSVSAQQPYSGQRSHQAGRRSVCR